MLVEGRAGGLFLILNGKQPWLQVDLPGLQGSQGSRIVNNDSVNDLVEIRLLAVVVVVPGEDNLAAAVPLLELIWPGANRRAIRRMAIELFGEFFDLGIRFAFGTDDVFVTEAVQETFRIENVPRRSVEEWIELDRKTAARRESIR